MTIEVSLYQIRISFVQIECSWTAWTITESNTIKALTKHNKIIPEVALDFNPNGNFQLCLSGSAKKSNKGCNVKISLVAVIVLNVSNVAFFYNYIVGQQTFNLRNAA